MWASPCKSSWLICGAKVAAVRLPGGDRRGAALRRALDSQYSTTLDHYTDWMPVADRTAAQFWSRPALADTLRPVTGSDLSSLPIYISYRVTLIDRICRLVPILPLHLLFRSCIDSASIPLEGPFWENYSYRTVW